MRQNINTINYVISSVCKVMGISADALRSESRERYLVTARRMVAYMLTKVYCLNNNRISSITDLFSSNQQLAIKKSNDFRRMMSLDKNLVNKCQLAVLLTDMRLLGEEYYNKACSMINI